MIRLNFQVSDVYIAENLRADLSELLKGYHKEKIFVLTDKNAYKNCFPKINQVDGISEDRTIVIEPGDDHKHIFTTVEIWKKLSHMGADRKSLLINLGGGMPTDMGGFAASTFKRGMRFINIPTTLLSQVDASVGGKTGINFEGFKNEIGVFNQAHAVLVDTSFLDTLDKPNILSGFAEMIKHTLIYSAEAWTELKQFNLKQINLHDLKPLVADSIRIKEYFVDADPTEKGIRKALNFGHTLGHAIESFALKSGKPLLHGYAVAYGMVAELYLSHVKLGFPLEEAQRIGKTIMGIYGSYPIDAVHNRTLYQLTQHDKKNDGDRINFTLLEAPGKVKIDINCSQSEIESALNFYRSMQQGD
ncbi:MAG: 3-dehydroquinate synthase [Breznakibacter sp.]